jgi:phage-related protein
VSRFDYGFTFNGKHTYRDFGLILLTKTIGFSDRSPVLIRPPYSNTPIDQSNLYGHTIFGDRDVKAEFLLQNADSMSKTELAGKLTSVANWIQGSMGRQPLIDDVEQAYYYMGEPVKAIDWNELLTAGQLTIDWTCNPYRIAVNAEGNQRWNDLNADMDVAQNVQFDVHGESAIMLINASTELVQPVITTTGSVVINIAGVDFSFEEGTHLPLNQVYPLTLKQGVNYIRVSGEGTVNFNWYKEVI